MSSLPAFPRRSPLSLGRCAWMVAFVATLGLAGCVAPKPGAGLPPFGDTVNHTKQLQTYTPGDDAPSLGGDKAVEAMRGYRGAEAGRQTSVPMTSSSLP
ncbi:MAG: hypothetical protein LPK08_05175 [Halomonas sp.]|uniref:Uncharacterized protein n=1 Tax=Halomonas sulfidivorans TaxID=2733488 RepID=A0ABX7WF49_9GAMM|nr:hypothetical protein [Halomonas sulfidivorans]MDX5376900.1 hypothetical protein [Halomonas sp.]MDX5502504.1 hypothetical protein [Halomonas sp.]QTP58606.1 hypothetical protein HNO53_07775 [Halomonas sulfidivorans]